jgi:hypothetical protein
MDSIKYIEGSDCNYLIFKDGRVLSLKSGRWGSVRKFLKPAIGSHGYYSYNILIDGRIQGRLMHRLIASHFISNPELKKEVNHIDGNKLNNNVSNLEWCTRSENFRHAFNTGLYKGSNLGKKGALCKKSRPVIQKSMTGEFIKEWASHMCVQRALGFFQASISLSVRNGTPAYNFIWEAKR